MFHSQKKKKKKSYVRIEDSDQPQKVIIQCLRQKKIKNNCSLDPNITSLQLSCQNAKVKQMAKHKDFLNWTKLRCYYLDSSLNIQTCGYLIKDFVNRCRLTLVNKPVVVHLLFITNPTAQEIDKILLLSCGLSQNDLTFSI